MTMAIDQQSRHHLGPLDFGSMAYSTSSPQFNNPWSQHQHQHQHQQQHHQHQHAQQQQTPRPSTMSMPYTSLPATSLGAAAVSSSAPVHPTALPTGGFSTMSFAPSDMLSPSASDVLQASRTSYDSTYSSAPSLQTSSYAPAPSSYATLSAYGQSLAHQQHDQSSQRISAPIASQNSFDALDGARGMLGLSQTDITPRNIYGPRSDRGSTDSYGFPSTTHSSNSSISSSSGYPSYFGSGHGGPGSIDGSVTDYSSASEADTSSLVGMGSRTLPLPSALVPSGTALGMPPPAPSSMMGSFNSKISSNAQKKHRCKVCDKRFTRPSSLQTHMYSHTGEKPFQCEVPGCGRNFSVVSNLRRHRKVHKGDHRSADEADVGSPHGSWDSHE